MNGGMWPVPGGLVYQQPIMVDVLFHAPVSNGIVDTVGLSPSQESLVDPILRPIFFVLDQDTKATVLRQSAAIASAIATCPILNKSTLVGSDTAGYSLLPFDSLDAAVSEAATALGATYTAPKKYYVSSGSGSDSNDGLSTSAQFATINQGRSALQIGDTLSIDKGSVFYEQYEQVDWTRVTTHGSGNRPKITGAMPLPNASFSLTAGKTYTYEISLPSIAATVNTEASVTCSDVLMTWDDSVRMGGRFEGCATSINSVEATAGSQWWDSANKKLYIHPSDDSSPVSNGRAYEASVRTLSMFGGDNFYCEGIDAEKAYAKTSIGQQGYQLLGHKGGTYYKCSAKHSWNHCFGIANELATSNELLFDHCLGEDVEVIASLPGGVFVAYKGELAVPARVRTKNCVSRQLDRLLPFIQTSGFMSHGGSVAYVSQDDSAENCFYGIQKYSDPDTDSSCTILGTFTGKNNYYDVILMEPTALSNVKSLTGQDISYGISIASNGCSVDSFQRGVVGSRNNILGVGLQSACTDNPLISNSIFAADETPSGLGTRGIQGGTNVTHPVRLDNCTFSRIGNPLSYNIPLSNNNKFFDFVRIASDMDDFVLPGYFFSLAAWQAASGLDGNSVLLSSEPTLPEDIFTLEMPDVLGSGEITLFNYTDIDNYTDLENYT